MNCKPHGEKNKLRTNPEKTAIRSFFRFSGLRKMVYCRVESFSAASAPFGQTHFNSINVPSFLTITWDENQLLLLTARNHGKEVVFENAAYVSLKSSSDKSGIFRTVSPEMTESLIPEKVSESVLRFVQEHKLAKSDVVFVVSRSEVEVRPFTLPPIPLDEIPDAIRFQAPKEFNRYDPNSPIDFFVLNEWEGYGNGTKSVKTEKTNVVSSSFTNGKTIKIETNGGSRHRVLASTIRPELVKEITALCEKANLDLKRVVLHPCEETFLLRQLPLFSREQTYLLVETDPTEALLTIIFRGQPVFMRSPRLFGDRAERMKITGLAPQILAEIKRTLIAVRNEIQGISIDQIVMLGNSEDHQKLANDLSAALTIPVMQFDPWAGVNRGGNLKKRLPDSPELFAPLIGALLLAGRNLPSDIDYVNPKRRPPDHSKQKLFTAVAVLAVCCVLFAIGFGFWRNHAAKKDVLQLSILKDNLKKEAEEIDRKQKLTSSIAAWESNRFDWLSQLDWLSRKVPSSEDFMLVSFDSHVPTPGKGKITMKGLAKNAEVATQTVEQLRDDMHQPSRNTIGSKTSPNPRYPHQIDLDVEVVQKGTLPKPKEEKTEVKPEVKPEETPEPEEDVSPRTLGSGV